MKGHKKMGAHPHDKMSAMPQFNEGHWEKSQEDLEVCERKYTDSEMGNPAALNRANNGLVNYVKKHKAQH
jgi:hypothetical protein